jgi:catechol 2,3-dioxygenase-like lactoylglutathione lyase family enzyme
MSTPTPSTPPGEPPTFGTFNGHDVYPMPMFVTLSQHDLDAAITWYEAALGFAPMFVARGPDGRATLAHLRRARYQDVLLVPAASAPDGAAALAQPPQPRAGLRVSFQAGGDLAALATRARAAAPLGASAVEGPIDTPWNSTDVRVTDPAGHQLVLTGPRSVPDPDLAERMKAWLDAGRSS